MNHIEEARKVISESWGSAGNFNYAIDKAVKALDRAGLLVTDAQRSWIGRVAELEHLEARYALAFSMNTKQAAVVASMRAVVDAAVAFVKARREQQFSDQMRAGISLGETVDAWLAARNERVTDGLSRAQRGPCSECASLHARIAELKRERDVARATYETSHASRLHADASCLRLEARLAALEKVARQLYNAGSETLSAIETVVGCEVGTLHENDLCAKPLLKALDAYRAVDALRETEK